MRNIKLIVDEVTRLGQQEGLYDYEIAELLEVSRHTVLRIRKDNNIPQCKINNRKDKEYICGACGKKVLIRRYERRRYLCEECQNNTQTP